MFGPFVPTIILDLPNNGDLKPCRKHWGKEIDLQVVVCFAESHALAVGEGASHDYQNCGAVGWGGEEGRHAPAASLLPLPSCPQPSDTPPMAPRERGGRRPSSPVPPREEARDPPPIQSRRFTGHHAHAFSPPERGGRPWGWLPRPPPRR
jgi:hypothetical protein